MEHFGKSIRNTWKVLKCGAGEGWNISWNEEMRNEDMLQGVKEERNIIQTIKERKANWIGHILPSETCY